MSVSPFARCGARLIDRGYVAIPVTPGSKKPGEMRRGQWCDMVCWTTRFANRMPSKYEIAVWSTWPGAGIGVVLGPQSGGLIGCDIDTNSPEIVLAIRTALPPTTIKKIGAKGATFFFRGSGIVSKSFNDANGRRLCDLLAAGRFTVLPPSIHPETERPYRWIGPDALDYVAPCSLPLLPLNADDLIARALAPFGYKVEVERAPLATEGECNDGDNAFRSINNAALARLDAWVPQLGLYRCQRTQQGYAAVATWRASCQGRRPDERKLNLHITPKGVIDFGDGPRTYTAIDLVCAAHNCEWPMAFDWLSDAMRPGPAVTIALKLKSGGTK